MRRIVRNRAVVTGWLLTLAGLALLAWAALGLMARERAQARARSELTARASATTTRSESFAELESSPGVDSAAALREPRRRPRPGTTIARIRIATAGIDAIAFEGIDRATLDRGIGHFPGSGLPGEATNAAFAAHRDSFFRGLGEVQIGDPVEVATGAADYTYRVTATRVVEPSQVEVVADRGRAELTLVTCYPFDYVGPAPRRFVLHAELAESP